MSILDYFSDWKVTVTPITITQAPGASGNWVDTETEGTPITGVLYNRSTAERYYSQTWASDISEVFVTDVVTEITKGSTLKYGDISYSTDTPVNVGNQSEVWTVGLKVIK